MKRKDLSKLSSLAVVIAIVFCMVVLITGCSEDDTGPVDSSTGSAWIVNQPILKGNHFRRVEFTNANDGWLVGFEGIILKTDDGGITWMPQPSGSIANLRDVAFFDSDTGWTVGSKGTILRTVNGGVSWARDVLRVTDKDLYGVNFVSGRKGFAVGQDTTLLYSIDGGRKWKQSHIGAGGTKYTLLAIDIFDTIGVVVGNDGVILTGNGYDQTATRLVTDSIGADTFHTTDTTLNIDTVVVPPETTLVIKTKIDSIIYELDTLLLTVDTVWSDWDVLTGVTDNALRSVTLINASTGWAVGDNGTILTTSDGGASWTSVDSVVSEDLLRMHFTSANNGWILGRNGTILNTTNGGSSWSTVTNSLIYDLYDIAFPSSGESWIAGSLALLHSTSGGSSWLATPTGTALSPSYGDITFVTNTLGFAVGNSGAILRTSDAGVTWEYRQRGTQFTSSEWFRKVMFVNDSTGWCGGGTGVFPYNGLLLKTTDAGDTWERRTFDINTPPSFGFIKDLHFASDSIGWLIDKSQALKTSDGGSTWSSQFVPTVEELNGLAFIDSLTGWIVGGNGTILKTEDGGAEWFNVAVRDSIVSIDTTYDSENPDSIILIDTVVIELDTAPAITLFDVFFINANTGWAVGEGGTILRTDNGGESWGEQETEVEEKLASIFFLDASTGWTVGFLGTILHSTNGGTTWTVQAPPNSSSFNAITALNADDAWIVGENGLILSTTSGGK